MFLASQAVHRDIPDSVLSQTFFDGDGLFLYVPEKKYTNGKLLPASKLWRFKYTFQGKVVLMSFGAYPAMSLHDARERRQDARAMLCDWLRRAKLLKRYTVSKLLSGRSLLFR